MKSLKKVFVFFGLCITFEYAASQAINWHDAANSGTGALISSFWNTQHEYFNEASDSISWGGHYWPQAHALDVLVDAHLRVGGGQYIPYFDAWLRGVRIANGNRWANNYIDDMEWIGLAAFRAWKATGNAEFLTVVREVWDGTTDDMDDRNAAFGIKRAWTDAGGGGLFWESRRNRHSKNACANAPAAILATFLYNEFGNPDDLYWAKKIYHWQRETLWNPETGAVYDNINTNTGAVNTRLIFTYNLGTHIGAALELYKITGDVAYLNDAILTADYTINNVVLADDRNVLRGNRGGDGGLFRGIFIRYFTNLILLPDLSPEIRARYVSFLKYNGEMLWRQGTGRPKMLFGQEWNVSPGERTGLTEHLSGCMLMEALARIN